MNNSISIGWNGTRHADFGAVPLQLQHNLHQHPLFSEQSLARIFDNLGREDYYVNTMDVNAHNVRSRREGEITGLSGEAVMDAVKNGQIWILLLHPEKAGPQYRELLREIYAEIAHRQPGFRPHLEKMTILISSPNIQVYYHCDIPGQTLWQVRGNKKVYVYPNRPPFLDQASLERIALGEAHEISLPYQPSFDKQATIYDLQPGQWLHWPLNAPHRIVNGDCVNVSFTTEHFTRAIRRTYFVNYANGVLRHRLGWTPRSQNIGGLTYWAKFGLAAAYKLSGHQNKRRKILNVDFRVDPTAPRGVHTIPGYELRR